MEVPPGLIVARDSMISARTDIISRTDQLADIVAQIPDGPARESLLGICETLLGWCRSMGQGVEGIDELIRRVESTPEGLFPPGVDRMTDPQRRQN